MEQNPTVRDLERPGCLAAATAQFKAFWRDVACRLAYWLPLLLLTGLAYGFTTFNQVLSVDDLARSYYNLEGMAMVSSTRWGTTLWTLMFSLPEYSPFIDKFLGAVFLMLGATLFSAILYGVSGRNQRVWPFTAFACLFVTYPLINEIWEYSGANMIIGGNFVLVGLALLLLASAPRVTPRAAIAAGILMTFVASSYETGMFVYISMVMMILYLKHCASDAAFIKRRQWVREGLAYVPSLVIAVALRYIIGNALIALLGLEHEQVGATEINWLYRSLRYCLGGIHENVYTYGPRRFGYLPIAIFDITAVLFAAHCLIRSCRARSPRPLLIGFMLGLSLFGLSFLQGDRMPYRTAQTIQVFVGFTGFLLLNAMPAEAPRPVLRRVAAAATVLCMFLAFRQAVYLHWIMALDYQRSENEIAVIRDIGDRLRADYDLTKPVVFTGNDKLGDWISKQVYTPKDGDYLRLVSTNIQSILSWSKKAFSGQTQLQNYFAVCGYDINVIEHFESVDEYFAYEDMARSIGMQPMEIRDIGDCILVYFG